jgi:hypothetical protein
MPKKKVKNEALDNKMFSASIYLWKLFIYLNKLEYTIYGADRTTYFPIPEPLWVFHYAALNDY